MNLDKEEFESLLASENFQKVFELIDNSNTKEEYYLDRLFEEFFDKVFNLDLSKVDSRVVDFLKKWSLEGGFDIDDNPLLRFAKNYINKNGINSINSDITSYVNNLFIDDVIVEELIDNRPKSLFNINTNIIYVEDLYKDTYEDVEYLVDTYIDVSSSRNELEKFNSSSSYNELAQKIYAKCNGFASEADVKLFRDYLFFGELKFENIGITRKLLSTVDYTKVNSAKHVNRFLKALKVPSIEKSNKVTVSKRDKDIVDLVKKLNLTDEEKAKLMKLSDDKLKSLFKDLMTKLED